MFGWLIHDFIFLFACILQTYELHAVTRCNEPDLQPCARRLLKVINQSAAQQLQAIRKKHSKFGFLPRVDTITLPSFPATRLWFRNTRVSLRHVESVGLKILFSLTLTQELRLALHERFLKWQAVSLFFVTNCFRRTNVCVNKNTLSAKFPWLYHCIDAAEYYCLFAWKFGGLCVQQFSSWHNCNRRRLTWEVLTMWNAQIWT